MYLNTHGGKNRTQKLPCRAETIASILIVCVFYEHLPQKNVYFIHSFLLVECYFYSYGGLIFYIMLVSINKMEDSC